MEDRTRPPSNSTMRLRPEARTLSDRPELTQSQRDAFDHMISLLDSALDRIDAPSEAAPLDMSASLEDSRYSRVAMLEGPRGSGKTTLLLSLIRATSPDGRWNDSDGGLERLRGRVVWLETLDLEPHPRATNLLASILVRIEDKVGRFQENFIGGQGLPGGILDARPEDDPILELSRLQNDVALAWDGDAPGRGTQLGPDAYAVEVLRTEQARLKLNPRLRAVLDHLASKVYRDGQIQNPLFILPVDDFDLNPARSLEILRLLRMISVPRLFTVLLGSVGLVERVLEWSVLGELSALAGKVASQLALSTGPEGLIATSRTLSREGFRKLIPPEQRIKLRGVNAREALELRPPGADLTLHGLLERVELKVPRDLSHQDLLKVAGREVDSFAAFLLVEALEVPSRRIPLEEPVSHVAAAADVNNTDAGQPVALIPVKNEGEEGKPDPRAHTADEVEFRKPDSVNQSEDNVALVSSPVPATFDRASEPTAPEAGTTASPEKVDAGLTDAVLEDRERRFAYRALNVLSASLRQEMDIWFGLQELVRRFQPSSLTPPGKALSDEQRRNMLINRLAIFFHEWVAEEPNLSSLEVERLAACVRIDAATGMLILETTDLRTVPNTNIGWSYQRKDCHVGINLFRGEQLELHQQKLPRRGRKAQEQEAKKADSGDGRPPGLPITARTRGALIILHDLLALLGGHRIVGDLLTPRPVFAQARWQLEDGNEVSVPWTTPEWTSFWELDLFADAWNIAFGRRRRAGGSFQHQIGFMAYVWIGAVSAVVLGVPLESLCTTVAPTGEHWKALAEQVGKASSTMRGPQWQMERCRDWIARLACLLAPECGLPQHFAGYFMDVESLKTLWSEPAMVERIHNIRSVQAMRFGGMGNQAAIEGITLVSPEAVRRHYRASEAHDKEPSDWGKELTELAATTGLQALKTAADLANKTAQVHGQEWFETLERLRSILKDAAKRIEQRHPDKSEPLAHLNGWQWDVRFLLLLRHPINEFSNGLLCPEIPVAALVEAERSEQDELELY